MLSHSDQSATLLALCAIISFIVYVSTSYDHPPLLYLCVDTDMLERLLV